MQMRHQVGRELHQMDREDAVKLVERVLNASATGSASSATGISSTGTGGVSGTQEREVATADADQEEIEQLVDAVHCHARTLVLLAPALRSRGVEATHESLVDLMAEMDER